MMNGMTEKIAATVVKNDPNPQFFRDLDNDVIDYFAAQNGFLWSSDVSTSNMIALSISIFYLLLYNFHLVASSTAIG